MGMLNASLVNTKQVNGPSYTQQRTFLDAQDRAYMIRVTSSSGTLKAVINDFEAATWTATVSAPQELSVTLALDHPVVQDSLSELVKPNELRLYDGSGLLKVRFMIVSRSVNTESQSVTIQGRDLIEKLRDEYIGSYDETSAISIGTHISNFLSNWQNNSNPISKGTIAAAISGQTTTWKVENKSILSELRRMQQVYGGYLYVDTGRRLQWRVLSPVHKQLIHPHENLIGFNEEINYDEIVNRIYAEGGPDTNGDTVVIAGNGRVDDSTSQSAYGIRTRRLVNTGITDQTELTVFAQAELDRLKDPLIRRSVTAIDLSQIQPGPGDVRRAKFFFVGSGLRIKLPANVNGGELIRTNIVSVTRNLANPLDVQIEVGDQEFGKDNKTRSDYISDILDRLESLRNDLNDEIVNQVVEDGPFLDLTDTPSSYSEGALQLIRVNAAEDAVEGAQYVLFIEADSVENLGNPQQEAWGRVTEGEGDVPGQYHYPNDGTENDDWAKHPAWGAAV